MRWRVIIRMGLFRDDGSVVRNTFEPILRGCGIQNTQTGTWESPAVDPMCAAQTLSNVLSELANLAQNFQGDSPVLKHFWVYLDKVED
jgi:hypothetical protein